MIANWIPDINRWNLPEPPAWFLRAMWDQDSALVLIPSRTQRKYLIARRRAQSSTILKVFRNLSRENEARRVNFSDGDMLDHLNLVPVDAITGNVYGGTWSTVMLAQLKARDTWTHGGGDKYTDQLEANEQKIVDDKRAVLLDNLDHRARDSWRSYQARTGQRTRIDDTGISRTSRAKIIQVGSL